MNTLTYQLPEVLEHPFLVSERVDPYPFRPPSYTLPSKLQGQLPFVVIQDLCFLAYLNKDFYLCETPRRIEERVYGEDPCWEKRWAKMLHRWKEREEMDWEDLPFPMKPSEYPFCRALQWCRRTQAFSVSTPSATRASPVHPQGDPLGTEGEFKLCIIEVLTFNSMWTPLLPNLRRLQLIKPSMYTRHWASPVPRIEADRT